MTLRREISIFLIVSFIGGILPLSTLAVEKSTTPSATLSAKSGAKKNQDTLIVQVGKPFVLTAKPSGLNGLTSPADFSIQWDTPDFHGNCIPGSVRGSGTWKYTCTPSEEGAFLVSVSIYKGGMRYDSNVLNITALSKNKAKPKLLEGEYDNQYGEMTVYGKNLVPQSTLHYRDIQGNNRGNKGTLIKPYDYGGDKLVFLADKQIMNSEGVYKVYITDPWGRKSNSVTINAGSYMQLDSLVSNSGTNMVRKGDSVVLHGKNFFRGGVNVRFSQGKKNWYIIPTSIDENGFNETWNTVEFVMADNILAGTWSVAVYTDYQVSNSVTVTVVK